MTIFIFFYSIIIQIIHKIKSKCKYSKTKLSCKVNANIQGKSSEESLYDSL